VKTGALHYPVHHPGIRKIDSRYTVGKEWTGHEAPQFVARFCGEWIGASKFYLSAVVMVTGHAAGRRCRLVVTAQEATT